MKQYFIVTLLLLLFTLNLYTADDQKRSPSLKEAEQNFADLNISGSQEPENEELARIAEEKFARLCAIRLNPPLPINSKRARSESSESGEESDTENEDNPAVKAARAQGLDLDDLAQARQVEEDGKRVKADRALQELKEQRGTIKPDLLSHLSGKGGKSQSSCRAIVPYKPSGVGKNKGSGGSQVLGKKWPLTKENIARLNRGQKRAAFACRPATGTPALSPD